MLYVIGCIHPERLDGHILSLVRPAPDVGVPARSEGNLVEFLDLLVIQVIRCRQNPNFCTRLPQCSVELVLDFWKPIIVS